LIFLALGAIHAAADPSRFDVVTVFAQFGLDSGDSRAYIMRRPFFWAAS
jgi:hypothetical protein